MESLRIGVAPYFRSGLLETDFASSDQPGFLAVVTKIICEISGYNCTWVAWSDPYLGSVVNHSWTGGFLGALANGTFNTTLPDFFPTEARLPHFSFADGHIVVETFFLTRRPLSHVGLMTSLIQPFHVATWISIVATIAAVATVLTLAKAKQESKIAQIFAMQVLKVSVFLTRRSLPFRNIPVVSKFLLFFWGLNALVLLSCYSASLLSAMLNTPTKLPFNNFATLVNCIDAGNCRLILSPYADWFTMEVENGRSPDFVALKEALRGNPAIKAETVADTLELISNSHRTFLVSFPFEVDGILGSNCSFALVPYDLQVGSMSTFVFSKGNPTAMQFGRALRTLQGFGLVQKMAADSRKINRCRSDPKRPLVAPIHLDSLMGIFVVLLAGLALAIAVLICEQIELKVVTRKKQTAIVQKL